MSRWSWWGDGYPPSRPRVAEGGIKSNSQRGEFGESWWAKRWISVLESFDVGGRLARGRTYARKGQVLSLTVSEGLVVAKVQGSRPKPYDVAIEVKTLSPRDWSKVFDALGRQALFTAKLLAGEMPREIEPLFQEIGLSLFPETQGDLKTQCSCPDYSNPCKHIAAAYYLLGEEFDRDPFLIFTLRGMSRKALSTRLESAFAILDHDDEEVEVEAAQTKAKTKPKAGTKKTEPASAVVLASSPLRAEPSAFWGEPAGAFEASIGAVEIPGESAPLVRRLGGFPFWRGESPLIESLAPSYQAASARGLDLLVADASSEPAE